MPNSMQSMSLPKGKIQVKEERFERATRIKEDKSERQRRGGAATGSIPYLVPWTHELIKIRPELQPSIHGSPSVSPSNA